MRLCTASIFAALTLGHVVIIIAYSRQQESEIERSSAKDCLLQRLMTGHVSAPVHALTPSHLTPMPLAHPQLSARHLLNLPDRCRQMEDGTHCLLLF